MLDDQTPYFDDKGRLFAPRYEDRYHSDHGGLAETTHIFIQGNQLAQRFERIEPGQTFTIAETGLGTGLNFLACWHLFNQHAPPDVSLHYHAIEKHPLPRDVMRQALAPWHALRDVAYHLLKQYQPPSSGEQSYALGNGRVTLTLHIGDAAEALNLCKFTADAWLLDGFAPARNPAMWSPQVLKQIARLSRPGTTLATYTAAGFVRRGLGNAGFDIKKQPGFGTKRDMTVGKMPQLKIQHQAHGLPAPGHAVGYLANTTCVTQNTQTTSPNPPREALVIGAGVAGSFAARALADRGWAVTIAERQQIEQGEWPTLRPRIAIVQPKVSDQSDSLGRALRTGFASLATDLRKRWADDPRVGWNPCGVFHAACKAKRTTKLRRFAEQFSASGLCRWIDAHQTHEELGTLLPVGGIIIDAAGTLRPAGLCAALLDSPNITVRHNTHIQSLRHQAGQWNAQCENGQTLHAPIVIIASAMDAKHIEQTAHLDLIPVRGQASLIHTTRENNSALLRRVLCFDGYLTPALQGIHTLGASFILGDEHTQWRDGEHADLCRSLEPLMPTLAHNARQQPNTTGWVGIRCTSPTRHPYVGQVTRNGRKTPGLYTTLAHGSHGITSAQHAANQLAQQLDSKTQHAEA